VESSNGARPVAAAILLVDDDAATRVAVRTMLAPLGHDIVEADSGRAALRAVLQQPFAAVLMDVRMPGMDGYETAKLIRDRAHLALTPVIFITAYGQDEADSATAYANGAVDFIFTPINGDELRSKLSVFVALFVQAQQLQRSFASLTTAHTMLRGAQALSQAVLDNASDGIITTDEDGRIETFNKSAQRLFGYREDEAIGKPLPLVIASDHPGPIGGGNGGSPREYEANAPPTETVGCRKDGSHFPIEIGITETRLDGRAFTVHCIRDISIRKRHAELERQHAETGRKEAQRDRITFEHAPLGSIMTAPDGRIERVNKAACEMLGYTTNELTGMTFSEITHPDDRARSAAVGAALETSATQQIHKRYLHRDGRVIEVEVTVSAIRDEDQHIAQFFAQIRDVTDALRTSRELEKAQFEMLARLAQAAELHDDDTGKHTHRVGQLSAAIAQQLELTEPEVRMIRSAAPLHDVGKLALADTLLGKPGKLTLEEFEQMKTHTTSGAQMLAGSAYPLLNMAEQIALTHHEKWDGSGYPAGLAGEAIPLAGRIVAVADVFDALTHARSYKQAWSKADALTEMTQQGERHFDPLVLQAFLHLAPATTTLDE
jgi:putative two-component system response regulator